jgi:hypothetical protein
MSDGFVKLAHVNLLVYRCSPGSIFLATYYDIDYKQIQTVETDLQEKLRERERELRKRKEREEHEMERVRIKIRRKEAVTSFQALLVERIKDPTVKSFCSMWLN